MSKRYPSEGEPSSEPVPIPEPRPTDRFERFSPAGDGMFGERVLPWRAASANSVAPARGDDRSVEAERALQVVLSYLGFAAGNVEHALTDLLERTLQAEDSVTAAFQAIEAARLVALWVEAVELEVVRVGELERSSEGLARLGRWLFRRRENSAERPVCADAQIERAIADLARAAGALGARNAYLIARPLVEGLLSSPGLELPVGAPEPLGWGQLSRALVAAVEESGGSLLGVALLDAGRRHDSPEAARLRDVVGASTADGAQALLRRFEAIARERSELERQAGLNLFGLDGLQPDLAAERALLRIEDREGVIERYDHFAERVRRTMDDLRTASATAPKYTLEFGQGRLLEFVTAVAD